MRGIINDFGLIGITSRLEHINEISPSDGMVKDRRGSLVRETMKVKLL